MNKYWHELTEEEFNNILPDMLVELQKIYKQPSWCHYPEAIRSFGCWSLIDKDLRKKISHEFCEDCEFYNKGE